MIILDTHIWVWWVHGDARLPGSWRTDLDSGQSDIGVSAISCWEIAKLVEGRRIMLSRRIDECLDFALAYPRVQLLALTPRIAVESTQLPDAFHRDPADQIIVAAARVLDAPMMTMDAKISAYPHVKLKRVGP